MNFIFPAGLALGALSAPLIAMYFLRIRRRRVEVSSLLPWHALQKSDKLASPFQRFRRHILLLLQLLILLAMTLAFSRPYLETDANSYRSVVLVVDVSASMGAVDVAPNRLQLAVSQASEVLGGMGPADEAMLIVAGSRTEVVVPFTRDPARVVSALERLRASEAEGRLREGLQLALSLARSRPDVEVLVFSDGGGEDLSSLPTGGADIRFVRVGQSAENVGLSALDLRRSPVSDLDRQLFVTAENFGRNDVDATVEVLLGNEMVGLRTERLAGGSPVSMVFDLPSDARGDLHVRLDAPNDLLAVDNEAWAVLTEAASREVLLVGGDRLTARVLAADPRATVKIASPSEVTPELLASVDCTLFGGPVPDGMDGLNYAVLGPHFGGPARFAGTLETPSVIGWQRNHPVLRFVSWDAVSIAKTRKVTELGGLVPVVDADTGPLVLAGERNGGRVVQLAFDPFESDLPLRVAWPVLILNTVGWLTEGEPGASEAHLLPTGTPYLRKVPDGVTKGEVIGPRGTSPDAEINAGILRVHDTDKVGIYEVRAGDLRTRFAANLLSESESRIAPRQALGLADSVQEASVAKLAVGRRELWRPLLIFALLILMLEWWAWNRRKAA